MKKYIQLTAGRGPVECARAVTLVARELLKDFPDAELVESEPHNTEQDCYMSMLFLAETDAVMARSLLLLKLQQRKDSAAASFRSSKWCKHTTLLRGNPVKTFSGAL